MHRILRRRPSPALVIACLALFVSLSGVSYGVATGFIDSREIKDNTIQSKDIRNSGIRTEDIRNNEIRGFDIRNSTVRGVDVALNTLTGADVDEAKLGKVPAATDADKAEAAKTAETATKALTPVAFARVSSTGDVIEASSRDVADANVTREKTAAFCFRGLGFEFKSAQVTIDYGAVDSTGTKEIAQVALGNPKGDCAATPTVAQLEVVTAEADTATAKAHGFFIWFYN
jgi:hypothetical protein